MSNPEHTNSTAHTSNSAPTPPVDPRIATALPSERRSRRTRVLIAGGLAAAVGIVSIGGQLVSTPQVAAEPRAMQSTDSLGDLTLDELADELKDLGLSLSIEPLRADRIEADESADDGGDDSASDDSASDDPFEGYTDAEIDAMSDEEFFDILEQFYGEDWEDHVEFEGDEGFEDDHDHEAGEEEVLGTFAVDGDSIDVSNASPEVAGQATEIWERFVQLIPADQREMLTSFELNPAEASGAYVYPNDDPTTWSMGVSIGLGGDLDYVLIHEFAHLLTLQAKEVPPGADTNPDACPTYFTGEGCALSGTTMATFVERFWPASQLDEIARLQDAEDYEGLEAFYENNRDDFVTDYATNNPAEDLAETFTVFVLNDRPTGNTIADQKVNLLWDDPSMVALREQIRANR